MTAYEFVKNLWESSEAYDTKMDIETARADMENFAAEGWDMPEITPEQYMEIWNELVDEHTLIDVSLSNGACIFDSRSGFETVASAIEWAKGRGSRYVIQIGKANSMGISISCVDGKYSFDDGDQWVDIPEDKLVELVTRYI